LIANWGVNLFTLNEAFLLRPNLSRYGPIPASFDRLFALRLKRQRRDGLMPISFRSYLAAAVLAASFAISAVPASAQVGHASWYALTSKTANGERCNPNALTAAHRTLPFGTKVKVENLNNGKSVVVRINDRGPFVNGRIIDLTRAAAKRLGFVNSGVAKVRVTVIEKS
jgi:rare lipoprotein A